MLNRAAWLKLRSMLWCFEQDKDPSGCV